MAILEKAPDLTLASEQDPWAELAEAMAATLPAYQAVMQGAPKALPGETLEPGTPGSDMAKKRLDLQRTALLDEQQDRTTA